MAQVKRRFVPDFAGRSGPRVAGEGDTFIQSPVHRLLGQVEGQFDPLAGSVHSHSSQGAEGVDVHLYPGWFRLLLPIALSVGLWAVIIFAVHTVL